MPSVTPRHEVVEVVDLAIRDAAKYVGEPGLRIDAVELSRFDGGVRDCHRPRTPFPAQGDGSHGSLSRIGI